MISTKKAKRAFRPGLEGVEARSLAAVGAGFAARGALLALREHMAAARADRFEAPEITSLSRRPPLFRPRPGATLPIGPGLGQGLTRLTIPLNYVNYGVTTLWNNTTAPVTFSVSASTFASGRFFVYSLNPGEYRSFYATNTTNGQSPTFQVAINPNFPPVTLTQVNTVYESSTWVPSGTEGRPYAINVGVNGLYLSYI